MISFATPKHHWNYFLAIEKDLEKISRYIEFASDNLNTYSIELTHLLLSASSEVDVILKQLCYLVDSNTKTDNINQYRTVIQSNLNELIGEEITIDRFGLKFKPWDNWNGETNPNWWKSYNNVKHQRNNYFNEANLKNTINAVGALLIVVTYYYKTAFQREANQRIGFSQTSQLLNIEPTFIRMNPKYYNYSLLLENGS